MKLPLIAGLFALITAAHGQNTTPEITETVGPPNPSSTAQKVDSGSTSLPKDFLGLADLRAKINSDIVNLEKLIKDLEENDIPRARFDQSKQKELSQTISELEKQQPADPAVRERVSLLKSELRLRSTEGATPELLSQRLIESKVSLEQKRELAAKIQSKIASMLSPEQEFKRTMSITFALLIACVIIGFFAVSFRDDKIRQAIFSGEAGIQFLTLFSLVIAIILFGITQILEGKELAALLGGLSGYILGRTAPKASTP